MTCEENQIFLPQTRRRPGYVGQAHADICGAIRQRRTSLRRKRDVGEVMPGPVSDCYDPEFSTTANAYDVSCGIKKIVDGIGVHLGPELKNIVGVVHGPRGKKFKVVVSERDMRIIRFALNRALETI